MKTKIANKWVKKLESGKYKQGTEFLRTGDEFCCFGVLCDLFREETGKGRWIEDTFVFDGEGATDVPQDAIIKWAGLQTNNGNFGDCRILTEENDDGVSFEEIAKIIKEHKKVL